ncbi:MAG: hypothetical protein NXY57DRAFT_963905 [Lentinula lateritia]|nr:MAG: hypothetical protein NXY57DRAFT_963905 [Lentinula lateritia]
MSGPRRRSGSFINATMTERRRLLATAATTRIRRGTSPSEVSASLRRPIIEISKRRDKGKVKAQPVGGDPDDDEDNRAPCEQCRSKKISYQTQAGKRSSVICKPCDDEKVKCSYSRRPSTVKREGGGNPSGERLDVLESQKEVTVRLSAEAIRSGSHELITLTPTTHQFTLPHPIDERRRVLVERTQVPVMPRFALVEYETIGIRFKKIVMDTQNGLYAYQSPYMTITKSDSVYFSNRIQDSETEEDAVSANDLRKKVDEIERSDRK